MYRNGVIKNVKFINIDDIKIIGTVKVIDVDDGKILKSFDDIEILVNKNKHYITSNEDDIDGINLEYNNDGYLRGNIYQKDE